MERPPVDNCAYHQGPTAGRDVTCTICLKEIKETHKTVVCTRFQNAVHDSCFGFLLSSANLDNRVSCPICRGLMMPYQTPTSEIYYGSGRIRDILRGVEATYFNTLYPSTRSQLDAENYARDALEALYVKILVTMVRQGRIPELLSYFKRVEALIARIYEDARRPGGTGERERQAELATRAAANEDEHEDATTEVRRIAAIEVEDEARTVAIEAERVQARNSNENPTRHGNGEHDGSGLTLWAEDAAYSALVQRMRDDPNRRSAARQAQYQAASSLLSDRYRATRGLFHDRYLASQRLLATNGYLAWEMLTNQYHASQRLLTDQNSAARRLLTDRHPAAWRRLPVRRLLPARRLLAVSTGSFIDIYEEESAQYQAAGRLLVDQYEAPGRLLAERTEFFRFI